MSGPMDTVHCTMESSQRSHCSVASPVSASAIHDSCSGNTPFSPPSIESTSIDAQPVCLVSHGSSMKIVALKGSRKLADLQESLRTSRFAHLMTSNPLIQIYSERFKCFVDLDDTTVNDGALINLVVSPDHSSKAVEQPLLKSGTACDENEDGARHEEFSPFRLPQMPIDIALHLRNIKSGEVPDNLRKKIIEWASFHLSSQTMYPNKLYNVAAVSLVNNYPQLRDSSDSGHILNECRRLTGVSPDEALLRALKEFSKHILNAAAKKHAAQSTLCSLQTDIAVDNRIARNWKFTLFTSIRVEGHGLFSNAKGVGAIMSLPFLVNERGGDIFTEMVPGKVIPHPTLLYSGGNPICSDAMCVTCENVSVDVLDFTSGLSLLFSMYWAYNIEYVPSAKGTLSLLEQLMGIGGSELSTKVLKVLTTLKARAAANKPSTSAVQPDCTEQSANSP